MELDATANQQSITRYFWKVLRETFIMFKTGYIYQYIQLDILTTKKIQSNLKIRNSTSTKLSSCTANKS